MKEKNVAILGGSFNPIHMAHLVMAQHVYDTGNFDEVLLMPTGYPPHKMKDTLVSDTHRLNMCDLATSKSDYIITSDFECHRGDTVYTIDTLTALKEMNKDHNYYMIIGADSLFNLTMWKDYQTLLTDYNFIILNRPPYTLAGINEQISIYKEQYNANIRIIDMPNLEISSSYIRKKLEKNEAIKYMVPEKVEDYIYINGLYYTNDYVNEAVIERIKRKLKKKLEPDRYEHTLSTIETAQKLAMLHGCNVRQSVIAALLHDCAKNYSDDKKLDLCHKYELNLSKEERHNIDLVHAKLGAEVARDKYLVSDEKILSAIRYHTTGKEDMSDIDKVIYIADFIEPLRNKAENLDEARELAEISLDLALKNILKHTVKYLDKKDKTIDQRTINAYRYYKDNN